MDRFSDTDLGQLEAEVLRPLPRSSLSRSPTRQPSRQLLSRNTKGTQPQAWKGESVAVSQTDAPKAAWNCPAIIFAFLSLAASLCLLASTLPRQRPTWQHVSSASAEDGTLATTVAAAAAVTAATAAAGTGSSTVASAEIEASQQTAGRHSIDPVTGCDPARLDVVFATTTNLDRHSLIKASRGHRQGMRLLVFTNVTGEALAGEAAEGATHCEQWSHLPDRYVTVEGFPRPLLGELRLATAPFAAHALVMGTGAGAGAQASPEDVPAAGSASVSGSVDSTASGSSLGRGEGPAAGEQEPRPAGVWGAPYKWMMYGDDDTLWFHGGVAALARQLDPELPWFLTDNYYTRYSPGFGPRKAGVPRCLPCTLDLTGIDPAAHNAVASCGCTPLVVCGGKWNSSVDFPCDPERPPLESNHGGAGSLLSVGLLRRAPLAVVQPCLDSHPKWLGDHAFFHCLWLAGLAPTDPAYSLRHPGSLLFDALDGSLSQLAFLSNATLRAPGPVSAELWVEATRSPAEVLAGTAADGVAGDQATSAGHDGGLLRSMVSMHIAGSRFCSSTDTAQAVKLVYELYDAWQQAQQQQQQPVTGTSSPASSRAADKAAAAAAAQRVRALAATLLDVERHGQGREQDRLQCLRAPY